MSLTNTHDDTRRRFLRAHRSALRPISRSQHRRSSSPLSPLLDHRRPSLRSTQLEIPRRDSLLLARRHVRRVIPARDRSFPSELEAFRHAPFQLGLSPLAPKTRSFRQFHQRLLPRLASQRDGAPVS